MKKSVSTRVRITKNGKVMRRKMAQCHFRAKKTPAQMRRKKGQFLAYKALSSTIMKKPGGLN
jgi:ribosomal protein L35